MVTVPLGRQNDFLAPMGYLLIAVSEVLRSTAIPITVYLGLSWLELDRVGSSRAQPPETSPHLFLCAIPIEILMKVFEAKERTVS